MPDSRAFLNASYRSLLRSYILSPFPAASTQSRAAQPEAQSQGPSPALLALLSSPRAAHIDLSYLDDASGTALLHEAARRRDLRLIELAVRAGADVFARDKRGKMPGGSGKDDKVKVFLRQCGFFPTFRLFLFQFCSSLFLFDSDESRCEPNACSGCRAGGTRAPGAAWLSEQVHECREGL
jgi:ankyrin repeat protein